MTATSQTTAPRKMIDVGRTVVRACEFAIQIGGLMAAYGWYVEDAGWMSLGAAVAGGSFLAGLAFIALFLVVIAAIWILGSVALSAQERGFLGRKGRPDTGSSVPRVARDALLDRKDRPDTGSPVRRP